MALRFDRKERHLRRQRVLQIALAGGTLLLAAVIVALWVSTQFLRRPADKPTDISLPGVEQTEFTAEDTFYLLIMHTDQEAERFTLVTADPAAGTILATAIPPDTAMEDARTPAAVYRKSGAAAATALIAGRLQIPLRHYVAFTGTAAETWFNYLEKGITVTLSQAVQFTDTDGIALRLEAGEHNLTATQTVKLIRYTGWSQPTDAAQIHAAVTAAAINQYFRTPTTLEGDFAQLSNLATTNLHINDFVAARERLHHLATGNRGDICRTAEMPEQR